MASQQAAGDQRQQWLELAACSVDRMVILSLLRRLRSADEIFGQSDEALQKNFSLSPRQCAALRRRPPQKLLDKQLSLLDKHCIDVVPLFDERFPRNLFELTAPPPVIFAKGTLAVEDRLAVGIVGPRTPTGYGLEVARSFTRDFAPLMTVVSGAALGIDSVVHETALNHGGRTLAVLGCGIDIDYPASNARLRARIASENGALVSTYPPGTAPLRGHFPARNVILAGLSLAVIVVEASPKSGALVTARAAADEGRPVYAVPGDITRNNSMGVNRLLREGATACMAATDVIEDLEHLLTGELTALRQVKQNAVAAAEEEDLTALHYELLETIRHAPTSHDSLIDLYTNRGVSHGELSTVLLELEMDGHIHQLPGRVYSPKL